jgi:hypothetical protein
LTAGCGKWRVIRSTGNQNKVRIVILWWYQNVDQIRKILVTNRIAWEVTPIVRVYWNRWTGMETLLRAGHDQSAQMLIKLSTLDRKRFISR